MTWFFEKERSSKEIPVGGLMEEPGSSRRFKTGDWRSLRPIVDEGKCIHCMFCVVYCPENCIKVKGNKKGDVDMDYCKGCGICAKECPVKCIEMKEEESLRE